jgi:hypothetical protein
MFGFPPPTSLPCPECGAAVSLDGGDHVCDEERRRWHQFFLVNAEIEELENEVRAYLRSPEGRFEAYYAERQRLAPRVAASGTIRRRSPAPPGRLRAASARGRS